MKKYLLVLLLLLSMASFAQDLVVTGVSGPESFFEYGRFADTISVKNLGIVPTGEFRYEIYLTNGSQFDYGVNLGGGSSPSIEPGESNIVLCESCNSFDVAPGQYFLRVRVDSDNGINETNEYNNDFTKPGFEVKIPDYDFTFSSFKLDKSSVTVSDGIHSTFTIHNSGSTQIDYIIPIDYYLSKDVSLTNDDIDLGYLWAFPLKGTSDYSAQNDDVVTYSLIIPEVVPGSYYLIGKVNQLNNQNKPWLNNESNPDNNVIVSSMITVGESKADLGIVYGYTWGYSSDMGLEMAVDVKNNGSTSIFGYNFNVYLSTDSFFDSSDVLVPDFRSSHDYILPGQTQLVSISGDLIDIPYGTYHAILVINPDKNLVETNYDNNTYVMAEEFEYFPPPAQSLTITDGYFKENYNSASVDLKLLLNFYNSGERYTNNLHNTFTIKDEHGVVKAASDYNDPVFVDPENSVVQEIIISLMEPLPVGNYTVEVSCADLYNCFTNSYSIPLVIKPAPYVLTGTVKGEDAILITEGKLFLYQKADDGVVKFVQKLDPTLGSDFIFELDIRKHTLYFIPDATVFSAYVPTIFGKTVTLQESSFFNLTKDSAVVFEILKLQALASGSRKVTGIVSDSNTSGRLATNDKIYSIILLNSAGLPVAVTQTDSNGSYTFENLPADDYKIVVSGELDAVANQEPFAIDIKQHDVAVDFALASGDVTPNVVTGIEAMNEVADIYPNPTRGILKISDASSIKKIEWVDVLGKSEPLHVLNNEVDVTRYKAGVYLLKVQRNTSIQVLKVVKE